MCSETEQVMPVFRRIKKKMLLVKILWLTISASTLMPNVFERDEKDVVKADCLQIYKPSDLQSAYGEDDSLYCTIIFSVNVHTVQLYNAWIFLSLFKKKKLEFFVCFFFFL